MIDESEEKENGFHIIDLMKNQTYFTSFYDLLHKEKQELTYKGEQYRFREEDCFYVKYYADRLLVFIIKSLSHYVELTVFSKKS